MVISLNELPSSLKSSFGAWEELLKERLSQEQAVGLTLVWCQ